MSRPVNTRISLSLAPDSVKQLDTLVKRLGHPNRSRAVAELIRAAWDETLLSRPEEVMAGTVTLLYSEKQPRMVSRIVEIVRRHIDEVITSLVVPLESGKRMECWVVQGPVSRLLELQRRLRACKGLEIGRLTLTGDILPPLHSKTKSPLEEGT